MQNFYGNNIIIIIVAEENCCFDDTQTPFAIIMHVKIWKVCIGIWSARQNARQNLGYYNFVETSLII